MLNLVKEVNKKINGIIWSFVSTGVVLLMLAVLIVWTDFMLKLVVGLMVVIIGGSFIYSGYKIWTLKKEIDKHCFLFRDTDKR